MQDRRYDIDWLRVITIGLLLIYHIGISFQPWASLIYFIQSPKPATWLWAPMAFLNIWRIPLLFFVSGMGVCFAMRQRNWKGLMLERSRRIFLPLVFGIVALVPIHIFIFQANAGVSLKYMPDQGHLWFLTNIFVYTLILSPFFFLIKRHENSRINQVVKNLMGHPLGIAVMMLLFMAEAYLLNPPIFEFYAQGNHGFFLGMLAFLFGYLMVYNGEAFWNLILRVRWALLILGIALFALRLLVMNLKSPLYLMSLESNIWVLTALAFGLKYLNRPSQALSTLSQAAYPIYIIHMIWQYLGAKWIFSFELPSYVQWLMLMSFTFATCYLTYDLLIRRIPLIRPLFGLPYQQKKAS
ncbi:acyltransferase family protein [Reichenbachiella ulvae]|uniref:Acyltransferase family protein n=1 Tax=Reichenbachiella ulvae TaxID=2980104 RepID=A0ABT3CS29_9BACT|nr:acyltransferase family protein [Reichenbachiella ulvae]MCV9386422.1 acyltransferase family protein [Reichenbachiella ulvae]